MREDGTVATLKDIVFVSRDRSRAGSFEDTFTGEMLASERLRATIIAAFFLLGGLFIGAATLLFPQGFPREMFHVRYGLPVQAWYIIFFAVSGVYEIFVRWMFGYFMRTDRPFPRLMRYGNAIVEVSGPTVIVFIGSILYAEAPSLALNAPIVFLYFIFIALSSFRLSIALCLFTGALAAVEYLALALWLVGLPHAEAVNPLLLSQAQHIGRAALLLVAGIVTGFVALQVRRRIFRAHQAVQERERVMDTFGQHVSPAVVNKLLEQKGEFSSEMRHVCMMFLDIRNFTAFSAGRDPEYVIGYLNTLFDFMIDIVNAHNGIINKFLGDGFMAVFGAPLSDGRDSLNAVRAGRAIIERLAEEVRAGRVPATTVGIGLHAGRAVTGNVGSSVRKEYTIIGDVVNLASRIEQLNKQFGSQMLVSSAVREAVAGEGFVGEDLGPVEVKGLREPIRVYRLA